MLELGVERLNRGGAHLLNETVIAIEQLAMVGGVPLMGPAVNMQVVVEEICLHKTGAAMSAEAANLAVAHLAGRQAGHHPIGETEGGIDVIDRSFGATTAGGRKADDLSLSQFQHEIEVMDHQIQHHRHIIGSVGMGTMAAGLQHHHFLIRHHLGELPEGRIETFNVANLQEPAIAAGSSNQG